MLKRGAARSSDALPSAVTSTTAQGLLPQFTNYSMGAALSSTAASPESKARHSPSKSESPNSAAVLAALTAEKHNEIRRPQGSDVGPASLEEQFRNIVAIDAKNRSLLPGQWKPT